MDDNEWHYTDSNDQDVGPCSFDTMVENYKRGVIKGTTFIWHPEKCPAWAFLDDKPDIKKLIDPPKAPPPPPARHRQRPPAPVPGHRPPAPAPEKKVAAPIPAQRAAAPIPAQRAAAPIPAQRAAAPIPGQRAAAPIPGQRAAAPIPQQQIPTPRVNGIPTESGDNSRQRRHSRTSSQGSNSGLSGPALAAAAASAKRRSVTKPATAKAPKSVASRIHTRHVSDVGKQLLYSAGLASTTGQGWMERKTADGVPYYHNVSTGALSWDKPDELKDSVEIEQNSGNWIWYPDEEDGYVPAMITKTLPDGRVTVQMENGHEATTKRGEVLHPLSRSSLARTEKDLTLLDSLDEGLILYNLRKRFEEQQQIYTWVGTILISINPYETFPIYGVENIYTYKNRGNRVLDPHVYVVADEALKPLLEYGENHSILISGESGAGKTWNTKQCLSYLTEVTHRSSTSAAAKTKDSGVTNVEGKILAANPILEAFGNAKTVRNDNSSRFGRFTEVHFKNTGTIGGARIDNFLLEKSRVVLQGKGERNYHIFYQILNSGHATEYGLGSMENYCYLNKSGCYVVDGVDDHNDYEILIQAFEDLDFTKDEVKWVLELTSAILHLGNATFVSDGGEGSRLTSDGSMEWISRLLHVDPKRLEFALVHRSIEVRGTTTNIPLNPTSAQDSRDALAKSIYGQLFDWLVARINQSLCGDPRPWAFIGLLDIFGFEIFEHNSFEQLCINFTNEKLQQLFNRDTFKAEEAMYKREGVQFEHISYVDNQPILDMIEKRPVGLLLTLDDMNRMPKSTDEGFVAKADSNHAQSKFYISSTRTRMGNKCFTIQHYAGDVIYNTDGFLAKNKDLLYADLYDVMTESTCAKTAKMFPKMDKQGRARYSLGAQFRKQLDKLMGVLNETQTHYIRCVKPNEFKAARMFSAKLSLEQLRYSGVFEAVRIRKQGFPFRYTYERFVERYKCVLLKGSHFPPLYGRTAKEKTKEIIDGTGQDFSEIRFGKTRALYRAEQHRLLELLRALSLERVCAMIQAIVRGYMARRFVAKVRFVQPKLEKAVQSRDVTQLDNALKEYARVCGHFSSLVADTGIVQKAKRLKFALVEWEKLAREMDNVVRMDIANDELAFEALKNVVWKAEDLLDEPGTEWHTQMYDYSKDLFEKERFARLDPKLNQAMDLLERDLMTSVYSECKNLRYKDPRLEDIEKFVGLGEEDLLKLQYKKAKKLGLEQRAQDKEINIREMFLDRNQQMFKFEEFNSLRDPVEYASRTIQFWKRDEIQRTMLKWQKKPITNSLTQLEAPLVKQSIRLHKAILGWCGDKNNPSPNSLAQEIIASGVTNALLRDEIYCLILKQVSENPNEQSKSQGWKLFGMCVQFFPPSTDLGNYLHVFVRTNAPQHLLEKFRQCLYAIEYKDKDTLQPPDVDQIPQIAANW